ncbi:MAG TPA: PepSY domain-containing protein [Steroidobacteraceae bacterium]|nr:PepSY domain-containing protein [Steroidobacteraceae bacterium]
MTYRGLWRWHFHAGLFCIPFVIVLALTGSIYLFKPQIDALADREVDSLQVTGQRASGETQIAAAIASLPGSKLFVYEIPREADDAVRVHLYGPDGAGRIVYVHPETLAILKSVPHNARLTEIVRMLHSELLAGKTGSLLIELAASWALIMLGTGLYLWWPRDTRGAGGVLYPRLGGGRRVFWRDLHAVSGIWISAFALFLLVTAMPWTTVVGDGIGRIRGWVAPAPQDWTSNSADEHAAHRRQAAAEAVSSPLQVDDMIARVAPYRLDPPVRLYLPNENQPYWRVRSETQNRPRVRELSLDPVTGAVLHEDRFADKSALDKAIHVGIAAHEGQLFGIANQLLGLFTALGLLTICVSAIAMWWRSRPAGSLGVPAPRVPAFRIGPGLMTGIVAVALLLPVLGASVVVLALSTWLIPLRREA